MPQSGIGNAGATVLHRAQVLIDIRLRKHHLISEPLEQHASVHDERNNEQKRYVASHVPEPKRCGVRTLKKISNQ
jgi:hypothetical protein